MSAETDLEAMLSHLGVTRRPGTYTLVSVPDPPAESVEALIREEEGVTVVTSTAAAERHGWAYVFEAAWLTLDVHSSLQAVGLTAAVSASLAGRSIPCNVLAGYFHDHLLVPADRVDDAVAAIADLRRRRGGEPDRSR